MGLVWAKPAIIACVVEAADMWLKAATMTVARESFINADQRRHFDGDKIC